MDSEGIERIFLRFVSNDDDEKLSLLLKKYLVPAILLSLENKNLIPKVNELLVHINKRLTNRPEVQLPFYDLISLIKRDDISSFTMNMGVLYTNKSYTRLALTERHANVDLMLSCLPNKTEFQKNALLGSLLEALSTFSIPNYLEQQRSLIPSIETETIAEILFNFALKVILLPYTAVEDRSTWADAPGLNEKMVKDILQHASGLTPVQLEGSKKALVSIVGCELFNSSNPSLVNVLMVIAHADTRSSVGDMGEGLMKKLRNTVNWECEETIVLLYGLYLGADKLPSPKHHLTHGGSAASLRVRMKILPVLGLSNLAANMFPLNLQVVFAGLFGADSNRQLNLSAILFIHKICDDARGDVVTTIGAMLKQGLLKILQSASAQDLRLCGKIYVALGKLSVRCPELFTTDMNLLSLLFTMMEQENKELIADLREGLFLMVSAFKRIIGTESEATLEALLLKYINKPQSGACAVALRFSNTLHSDAHLPSRYLCLLCLGSSNTEVVDEAKESLKQSKEQPAFKDAVEYIMRKTKEREKTRELCYVIGTRMLPYMPDVYCEVLNYLTKCLEADIPETVVADDDRYLYVTKLLAKQEGSVVVDYQEFLLSALVPIGSSQLHLQAMSGLLQTCITSPNNTNFVTYEWGKTFLCSTNVLLRLTTASLIGLVCQLNPDTLQTWNQKMISLFNNKQASYEEKDGAILLAGYLCRSDMQDITLIQRVISHLDTDFMNGACTALYNMGLTVSLFHLLGEEPFSQLNHILVRLIEKNKEQKALIWLVSALGAVHVWRLENTQPFQTALHCLLETSKLGLLELNFNVGKALAMMSSGPFSKITTPLVFSNIQSWKSTKQDNSGATGIILQKIIREYILSDIRDVQYQGVAVWLLSLLKFSSDITELQKYQADIQNGLSVLLSNKDTATQEIASEALAVVYERANPEHKTGLIDMLKYSLLNEKVPHKHVQEDTKIFSEEDLIKLPKSMGGGSLTTYKELCSLASDMNQPELVYQFMHLSNHSNIWNEKVGAGLGVSLLVKSAGKEIEPFLEKIIPKLYRYQYDPNPRVQQSMSSIWSSLVPKPAETVDKHIAEIITELKRNLHHKLWRTRESCCCAVGDLIRNRTHNKAVLEAIPEFWELIFKLMDDIKESVRVSAGKAADYLSRYTITVCDTDHGSDGTNAIANILPVLLHQGLSSSVPEVQTTTILTLIKMSEKSGNLLNPHVHILIPAFIEASSTLEPQLFSQVTTMVSGSNEDKTKVEEARAQLALTSPIVSVIDKCLRHVTEDQLNLVVPKLASLSKSSVGLTPRIILLHSVSLLIVNSRDSLSPHVGKLMGSMFGVVTDRSPAIQSKCATVIALLMRYAKPSTVDNVMKKLVSWYTEKEDSGFLVSLIVNKISNTALDVLKTVNEAAIPLIVIGRHSENEEEKEQWNAVWVELGVSELTTFKMYLVEISSLCHHSLESSSWNLRKQSAKTLESLARSVKQEYAPEAHSRTIEKLLKLTEGRYWTGKEFIVSALVSTLIAPLTSTVSKLPDHLRPLVTEFQLRDILIRECRRSKAEYAAHAMVCTGELLSSIKLDCWLEIWDLCQLHLTQQPESDENKEEPVEPKAKKTLTIDSKIQESAILLVGSAWHVCADRANHVGPTVSLLSQLVRVTTWRMQPTLFCTLHKIVTTLDSDWLDSASQITVLQSVASEAVRGVDDLKHGSVRGLALNLLKLITTKLAALDDLSSVDKDIFSTVLMHLRDQISTDSNQNYKSVGVEIASFIEKKIL